MTMKREMVEELTSEAAELVGKDRDRFLEAAARFAAMSDDEYAAYEARAAKIVAIFDSDPLLRLELEIARAAIHGELPES